MNSNSFSCSLREVDHRDFHLPQPASIKALGAAALRNMENFQRNLFLSYPPSLNSHPLLHPAHPAPPRVIPQSSQILQATDNSSHLLGIGALELGLPKSPVTSRRDQYSHHSILPGGLGEAASKAMERMWTLESVLTRFGCSALTALSLRVHSAKWGVGGGGGCQTSLTGHLEAQIGLPQCFSAGLLLAVRAGCVLIV